MKQNMPMQVSDLRKLTSQTIVANTTPIEVSLSGQELLYDDSVSPKLRLLDGEYRFSDDHGILTLHLVVGEHDG